jgi:hypothetical protein
MTRTAKIILFPALFLSLLSATGCRPEGIIPPQDMAALIADFYRADAVIDVVQESGSKQLHYDSLRVYRPILEARGYTDSVFRVSLDYYLHDPKTLVKICTKARDELQRVAEQRPGELFVDEVDREEPTVEEGEVPVERPGLREGAEPDIEKVEPAPDTNEKPVRKRLERKQRKKMTRQELKQLEKELQ